tara:strand:- start:32 stop:763 length:732 start_codon:yes stop_codon:yes gene_type:complete
MKISYFHVPDQMPEDCSPDAAVVIDVLRATTTIAWALNNGAEAVQVFADLNKLRSSAEVWPQSSRLLLGERGGEKISGFDLGNSPVSVLPEIVSGKRLFMSTTNGTRALDRVRDVPLLLTASLPNRKSVAKRLLKACPNSVAILGSGWEGSYSLEDSLAGGALAESLIELDPLNFEGENDELKAALALWSYWKNDTEACLRDSSHGKRLSRLANHDADFRCCAEVDQLTVVPQQTEAGVLKAA